MVRGGGRKEEQEAGPAGPGCRGAAGFHEAA